MLPTGFKALNAVQFLDAFNENVLKLLIIFFLIHQEGPEATARITAVIGGLFVLPFLLFSCLGGALGDHWSKTSVIRATRYLQIATTICAVVFVHFKFILPSYAILFVMASSAALFGPSKYGIIGELVEQKDLLKANSWIASFTLFGVILGTFTASLLDTLWRLEFPKMFGFCVFIAILGTYFSFKIPSVAVANHEKPKYPFIYRQLCQTFRDMSKTKFMILSILIYSFFYFFGAFVQINIVPYSVEILNMDPNIGGYLFGFSAIGMGIGSFLAYKMPSNFKALAFYMTGGALFCFLFSCHFSPYWINGIWLAFIGIFAGLFLVPTQTFLIKNSVPEDRARNFATANFMSFVFALLAAGSIYVFNQILKWNAAQNFNALAWMSLATAALFYWTTRSRGSSSSNNP